MASQGIVQPVAAKLFGSMFSADSAITVKLEDSSGNQKESFETVIKQNRIKTEYRNTEITGSDKTERKTDDVSELTGQDESPGSVIKSDGINKKQDINAAEVNNQSVTEQTEDMEDDPDIDIPEMAGNFMMMIDNIITMLKEVLGITDTEFQNIMDSMGIEYSGLADQDILKQFVLANECNGDIIVALTDEEIADKLYTVLEQASQIGMENGFDLASFSQEDIEALKENISKMPEELLEKMNQSIENPILKEYVKTYAVNTTTVEETADDSIKNTEAAPDMQMQGFDPERQTDSNTGNMTGESGNYNSDNTLPEGSNAEKVHENSPKTIDQFINNIVEVKSSDGNMTSADIYQLNSLREIAYQIIEQVKVTVSEGQTSMQMILSPESLGKVELNIVSRNGIMTAQLATETQTAKEAIESQIITLRETLENQGVKVEAIEVTVSDFHFAQSDQTNGQQGEQKKGGKNKFNADGSDIGERTYADESLLNSMMEINGNTVSYRA